MVDATKKRKSSIDYSPRSGRQRVISVSETELDELKKRNKILMAYSRQLMSLVKSYRSVSAEALTTITHMADVIREYRRTIMPLAKQVEPTIKQDPLALDDCTSLNKVITKFEVDTSSMEAWIK